MASRLQKRDTGIGVSFVASTAIHVAAFLLLYWWGDLFPHTAQTETTYYVDVVNLPVASPRSGTPEGRPDTAEPAPPPPAPDKAMTLPTPPKKAPAAKQQAQQPQKPGPSEDEQFAKRMEKLRSSNESRQEEETIDRLRRKLSQSGRRGMPGGTGTQSGSDYVAYVQSRLRDAFRETISYDTKAPEMSVRLYIDQEGRLTRRKAERSSGDRAFELAVYRAIDLATAKLPPPPDHKSFERSFLFRPQGITNHTP